MPLLPELRAQRITSVLTKGLLSAKELKRRGYYNLGSRDPDPLSTICRQYVQPYSLHPYKDTYAEDVFYRGGGAIFPVVIERRGDSRFSQLPTNISKEDVEEFGLRAWASFIVMGEVESFDNRRSDKIPVQDFTSLIFPQNIWNDYTATSPVPKLNVPILLVTQSVQRSINGYRHLVGVPNYEDPVVEIIERSGKMYWIHAVRLPTHGDMDLIAA